MYKKILTLIMSVVLAISIIACGVGTKNKPLSEQMKNVESFSDTVTFGTYDGESIEWYVLENDGTKALLLSKYLVGNGPYNETKTQITWEKCSLRKWLNSEFITKNFTKKEQDLIQTTDIINQTEPNTSDKVFLLSVSEVKKYLSGNMKAGWKGDVTGVLQDWWWTRSPAEKKNNTICIDLDGKISNTGRQVDAYDPGIRPAMWVRY